MTLQNKIFCYIVTMTSKRKDDEIPYRITKIKTKEVFIEYYTYKEYLDESQYKIEKVSSKDLNQDEQCQLIDKMSNTLEQLEDFDFERMARDLNETRDGLGYEW